MLRPSRVLPALGLTFVALACGCGPAADTPVPAQAPPAGGAPAAASPGAPAEPEAVPLAELGPALEQADTRLRQLQPLLKRQRSVVEVERRLPLEIALLAASRQGLEQSPRRQQTSWGLESYEREWRRHDEQLQAWERLLAPRIEELSLAIDELRRMGQVWNKTVRQDVVAELDDPLAKRLRAMPKAIADLRTELRVRRDALIALQNRVVAARIDAADMLEWIEAATEEERQRLLVLDSPLLWTALTSPGPEESVAAQLRRAWTEDIGTLRRYVDSSRLQVMIHALVFLALLSLILALGRRLGRTDREPSALRAWAPLLSHPVSASLLLALILTRWIHPRAPYVVYSIVGLAALPPVVVLLRTLLPAALRRALYGLAGLFVADRLVDMTEPGSLLHRLVLGATTVLALAGLAWLLRRGGAADAVFSGRWRKAATAIGWAAVAALGLSAGANAFGNSTLAQFLTGVTLRSAYLAVVLHALVLVVRGTLTMALHARPWSILPLGAEQREILKGRTDVLIGSAGLVTWLLLTLEMARGLDPLTSLLRSILGRRWSVGTVNVSLGDLVAFGLALWASILVSRVVRFVLEGRALPRLGVERGAAAAAGMLARYGIITLGFLVALAAAGIHLDRIAVIFGALGVGVGFGLQSLVNHLVSGVILAFERPIQVGDTVEIGGLVGRVRDIGFRASTVQTLDGAEVVIPNGNLLSEQLVNWTLTDRRRRIEIKLGVAYGTDPDRVLRLLEDTARCHPAVLPTPAPVALFRGFGDSALEFSLQFWTAEFDNWPRVRSEISVRVNAALRDAGIVIPFPQREVRVLSAEPDRR